MYYLPRTIPADIKALLEAHLEDIPFEAVVSRLVPVVLRLFNARDALFLLRRSAENDALPPIRGYASAEQERNSDAMEALLAKWCEAGIDEKICRDFQSRSSCISYSAFSWPYGSLKMDGGPFSLPRDFTLLVPVSSQLCVRHESDPVLNGYFVLFFDSFPQLSDSFVQLITFLPAALSDVFGAYLRRERAGASQLGEFAHDMKRTLLFAAEQLHALRGRDAPAPDAIDRLERGIAHMTHRASAILIADRVDANNLKISSLPINLNEVVSEAVATFQPRLHRSGTELKLELAEDLPLSPIDPSIFPTVIENLLDNALKYSGPKACIFLRTKREGEDGVRLEVMDNGRGIPEAEWQDIFLKHYRGDIADGEPGNGLGLFLVRKIVEAHQGKVYPAKAEEMTTCFVIELPTTERR